MIQNLQETSLGNVVNYGYILLC